ncbi:putative PEP-binding protein [Nonomuraea antimicrobica]
MGLFRTEFLFLDRRQAPSYEEQVSAYAEVFGQAEHVVVRTLDAGTDKPLPFLGLPAEDNPALGVRGCAWTGCCPASSTRSSTRSPRRRGGRPPGRG